MNLNSSVNEYGTLYLCATPIGNLDDITIRVIKVLRNEVDLVAAEDTRRTAMLLNHFSIRKKLVSYHEHNKDYKTEHLIQHLLNGNNIALVSDAGTPAIADPGELLVKIAVENNIRVVPLPGANAGISALIASGLPTIPYTMAGFLPRTDLKKKEFLNKLKDIRQTIIIYEAPHRILSTLKAALAVLGNRNAVIGRELTKKYEEFLYFDLEKLIEYFTINEPRGEIVLLVDNNISEALVNKDDAKDVDESIIIKELEILINNGLRKNEAVKTVSNKFAIKRQLVYNLLVTKE